MKYFWIVLSIIIHCFIIQVKDFISAKQDQNEKLINNINDWLIDLINASNRKEIPENENPKKVVNNV